MTVFVSDQDNLRRAQDESFNLDVPGDERQQFYSDLKGFDRKKFLFRKFRRIPQVQGGKRNPGPREKR